MKALVRFMNLRSISGRGKMKATIEFLHDTEEQIIVFAEHRDVVSAIKKEFPDEVCTVTGSDSQQQKQWAIDSFRPGKENHHLFHQGSRRRPYAYGFFQCGIRRAPMDDG